MGGTLSTLAVDGLMREMPCKLLTVPQAFLKLVACPAGATLESVMDSADALFGWPAAALGVRFQRVVRRIQEVRH